MEWQEELTLLAKIATSQPHATYAAFIHGFVHKFTYLSRTNPNCNCNIPGRASPSDLERELFALPVRLGGLAIVNPAYHCSIEFQASISISAPLSHLIESQQHNYPWESLNAQIEAKNTVRKQRLKDLKSSATNIKSSLSDSLRHAVDLAQEKGASSWLSSLPLAEFGFSLHKGDFTDALALRYGWLPSNTPIHCQHNSPWNTPSPVPKGAFVCSDVCIEPSLQPITNETLRGASAITEDGARLDIAANGFWVAASKRHILMLESSTLMPHPTVNNASLVRTENTRGSRSGPTNNGCVK